jgi:hypothetical protein
MERAEVSAMRSVGEAPQAKVYRVMTTLPICSLLSRYL